MINSAVGENWDDVERKLFTDEEIFESKFRSALISEQFRVRQENENDKPAED